MNPREIYDRPTVGDVVDAMMFMAAALPFFPQDAFALSVIAEEVHKFVGTKEQLDWFKRKAVGWLAQYDGVPGLRALFCTRYSPFDGQVPIVDCPGFEEDRLEAEFRRLEMESNEARLAEYRRQALLAPPEDLEPLQLLEAKPIPEGNPLVHRQARALSAGAQLAQVEGAITCSWCAEGFARVRSSVSSNFIHTDTPVGRVVCKNRSADVGVPVTEPASAPQSPAEGSAS
jgi:hypothetical protein